MANKEASQTKKRYMNYTCFTKPFVCTVCKMMSNLLVLCMLALVSGKMVKVYDFLDYRDVPEKDAGFLTFEQDKSNSLILPPQYTICAKVWKWYERSKYTSFGTISLLDDFGNVTYQFFHGASWGGGLWLSEYHA